jgi:hypothetical protein
MNRPDDARVWMVTGALGSMALAVALIPLRGQVAASNLAFVFIAFTIIVAELGGRGAALVTALIAAMSLNFFLTEPYLTLTISKTDDVGEALARFAERFRSGRPVDGLLQDLRAEFDLGGLVLRDESGRAAAGARRRHALRGRRREPALRREGPAAARGRWPGRAPDRAWRDVSRPVGGERPGIRA